MNMADRDRINELKDVYASCEDMMDALLKRMEREIVEGINGREKTEQYYVLKKKYDELEQESNRTLRLIKAYENNK